MEEKERKQLYLEARTAEAGALNEALETAAGELSSLLSATLGVDDYLDLESLREDPELPPFQPGALATPENPPAAASFMPAEPSGIAKLVPGAGKKHQRAVEVATKECEAELAAFEQRERVRQQELASARRAHESEVENITAQAETRNRELDAFRADFEAGDPAAVVQYFSMVLEASRYPQAFPRTYRMAFVPESRQLVVEFELPSLEIVPKIKQYRYVRSRDEIDESPRPQSQIKAVYSSVVAQTSLRTIHELFEADRDAKTETIVFNGYVDTIDPATGKPSSPHLVTLRVSREAFLALDLGNVEPLACLKGLNASVSKSPSELLAVRPVLEFDMVDPRFVQEATCSAP